MLNFLNFQKTRYKYFKYFLRIFKAITSRGLREPSDHPPPFRRWVVHTEIEFLSEIEEMKQF